MALKKVNLRLEESVIEEIEFLKDECNKNLTDMIRELIDIGIYVKKKQLDPESKNNEDWDSYFKKVALKSMESRGILQAIFNAVFDERKSKFSSANEEIKYIMQLAKEGRNRVVGIKEEDVELV